MISAVIPNWSRPETLVKVILPMLERYSRISEIVISHGKKETAFEYRSRFCRVTHREDWDLDRKWGILRRLIAAGEAVNEIIWHQDDDVLVPEDTIEELLLHYRRQPNVLYGLMGRYCDSSLYYGAEGARGDTLLLAGQAMLYKKGLARRCFASEYQGILNFIVKDTPRKCAEDLFISLVALHNRGIPNRSYGLPYVDLRSFVNNDEAFSSDPGHSSSRTKFLRYAVPKMQLQEKFIEFEKKSHPAPRNHSAPYPVAPSGKLVRFARRWKKNYAFYFLLSRPPRFIGRWLLRLWTRKRLPKEAGKPHLTHSSPLP